MSSVSSVNSSAQLLYQMQQAAALKQSGNAAATTASQQVQTAGSDPDHDGDSDGAGGIDARA
jgi:hypothetical protein